MVSTSDSGSDPGEATPAAAEGSEQVIPGRVCQLLFARGDRSDAATLSLLAKLAATPDSGEDSRMVRGLTPGEQAALLRYTALSDTGLSDTGQGGVRTVRADGGPRLRVPQRVCRFVHARGDRSDAATLSVLAKLAAAPRGDRNSRIVRELTAEEQAALLRYATLLFDTGKDGDLSAARAVINACTATTTYIPPRPARRQSVRSLARERKQTVRPSTVDPMAPYFAAHTTADAHDTCASCDQDIAPGHATITGSDIPVARNTPPHPHHTATWHVSCWRRIHDPGGDTSYEPPDTPYADCGHPITPRHAHPAHARGAHPGMVTLPDRPGTLCNPCADNINRLHLANLLIMTHPGWRNGDSIITPQGGKLATVTTLEPLGASTREFGQGRDGARLWITGLTGRVWTALVPHAHYVGTVEMTAHPGSTIPPHITPPPPSPATVHPGDQIVVTYNNTTAEVLATAPDAVTIAHTTRGARATTEQLPWLSVRHPHGRTCCLGLPHLCRCINRQAECPLPGCNGRATAWIDRVDLCFADVNPEKVCQNHYEQLITHPGWSTPARIAT
jgi:hypothetical protein